ncbi:MAG: TatD family hydrolase [Sulfurovaceae bacterium]|nr:TatD family hydrolase [Sulfurovaceae bacterium]MDD5549177.1 TatD family hydrolase [Sulfurovaceae bacterium]
MIIDTHCHLDDDRYRDDLDEVINRAVKNSVEMFIIPAGDPDTLKRAIEISESYVNVYFAVGTHPYDAIKYSRDFIEEFISHPKCVAVGECGLDYYRLPDDKNEIEKEKKIQKEVFVDQIELANKYNKPLIVHIRDASHDSLEILEHYAGEQGGVLHCYNADHELLKLAKKGFYYGIGGVITFANARKLVEVYSRIPSDRLLIETDAPYLTPHPYRGQRNEPSYCTFVAQKMAELSGISSDEISEITTQNAKRLFGI